MGNILFEKQNDNLLHKKTTFFPFLIPRRAMQHKQKRGNELHPALVHCMFSILFKFLILKVSHFSCQIK